MKREYSEELISAYMDGELTADEQAAVEGELRDSAEYRQVVDDFRQLREQLQRLPRETLDANFGARVLRAAERAMLTTPTEASAPVRQVAVPVAPPSAVRQVAVPVAETTTVPAATATAAPSDLVRQQAAALKRWRMAFACSSSLAAILLAVLTSSSFLDARRTRSAIGMNQLEFQYQNHAAAPTTAVPESFAVKTQPAESTLQQFRDEVELNERPDSLPSKDGRERAISDRFARPAEGAPRSAPGGAPVNAPPLPLPGMAGAGGLGGSGMGGGMGLGGTAPGAPQGSARSVSVFAERATSDKESGPGQPRYAGSKGGASVASPKGAASEFGTPASGPAAASAPAAAMRSGSDPAPRPQTARARKPGSELESDLKAAGSVAPSPSERKFNLDEAADSRRGVVRSKRQLNESDSPAIPLEAQPTPTEKLGRRATSTVTVDEPTGGSPLVMLRMQLSESAAREQVINRCLVANDLADEARQLGLEPSPALIPDEKERASGKFAKSLDASQTAPVDPTQSVAGKKTAPMDAALETAAVSREETSFERVQLANSGDYAVFFFSATPKQVAGFVEQVEQRAPQVVVEQRVANLGGAGKPTALSLYNYALAVDDKAKADEAESRATSQVQGQARKGLEQQPRAGSSPTGNVANLRQQQFNPGSSSSLHLNHRWFDAGLGTMDFEEWQRTRPFRRQAGGRGVDRKSNADEQQDLEAIPVLLAVEVVGDPPAASESGDGAPDE